MNIFPYDTVIIYIMLMLQSVVVFVTATTIAKWKNNLGWQVAFLVLFAVVLPYAEYHMIGSLCFPNQR